MDAIFIPQLKKAPERTEETQVNESLPGLETLTPVRGHIRVQHEGNYLKVSSQAETIVTCICNRCLQKYNQRLVVDTEEIIWLDVNANQIEDLPLEREVAIEDLVESISPNGYFDASEWLYQQMCLAIPQRQLCDRNCPGITDNASDSPELTDSRWAALSRLKNQLP